MSTDIHRLARAIKRHDFETTTAEASRLASALRSHGYRVRILRSPQPGRRLLIGGES